MKSKLLVLSAISLLFFSCNNSTQTDDSIDSVVVENGEVASTIDTIATDKTETALDRTSDAHTSQNSLDWAGTYKGVLPCADCEGIQTSITLNEDMQYSIKTKYLGKMNGTEQVQTGVFSWDKDGSTLNFEGTKNFPDKFKIGEQTLTQLDPEGRMIKGVLAEDYILKK